MTTETVSTEYITDENVEDIIATAEYGGITYWASTPRDYGYLKAQAPEGTISTIWDGQEGKVYYLSADKIREAVIEIAKGMHTNTTIRGYVIDAFDDRDDDGIDCGFIDADTADCIIQVACFGGVVYG